MSRVKNSPTKRARHHKVLNRTKGFRMTKNRLYKVGHEAYMHALDYSFGGRKDRKSDLRALWIVRINAALRAIDEKYTYSRFVNNCKKANVILDRKVLADLAVTDANAFATVAKTVNK